MFMNRCEPSIEFIMKMVVQWGSCSGQSGCQVNDIEVFVKMQERKSRGVGGGGGSGCWESRWM